MMTELRGKLLTPAEFEETLTRLNTRPGNTRAIAYAYHVEGKHISAVAKEFDCTLQNALKALNRFAAAYDRLQEFKRNMAQAESPPPETPPSETK